MKCFKRVLRNYLLQIVLISYLLDYKYEIIFLMICGVLDKIGANFQFEKFLDLYEISKYGFDEK